MTTQHVPPEQVVATREQIIAWMRESGDSPADFYEAVANHFGIEHDDLTLNGEPR